MYVVLTRHDQASSTGTNTGECKRYWCSYRCDLLVKSYETQRRVWEGLPSCLPATPQIVYMVPRSGDSECTPLRSALSILFTLNLASQFTVGQLGNLGDDFNGPGTIATTTTRVSYGLELVTRCISTPLDRPSNRLVVPVHRWLPLSTTLQWSYQLVLFPLAIRPQTATLRSF